MKVIIIILQAILNLVRKRRDLIANRSKIPPEYRDDVVVWYSPKKQRLTNYDVIESYAEDFTNWNYVKARGTVTVSQHKFIITECILKGLGIVEDVQEPYSNLTVRITGITDNQGVLITDYVNGQHQIINTITEDGIYTIEDRHHFVGFGCNFVGTCNITIEQLPTSILKDFSGNGLDAYMYGFQGKLNSGVGIYAVDFTTYQGYQYAEPEFAQLTKDSNKCNKDYNGLIKDVESFNVKVDGVINETIIYYYRNEEGIEKQFIIKKDGVYTVPKCYMTGTTGVCTGFTINNPNENTDITITQIPDYPNSLCYAGKQYCKAYGLPIFDDYTIIARRTWFDKDGVFANKGIGNDITNTAFVFENKANNKTVIRTASFGGWNNVNIPNEGISYQTKNKYNNADITYSIGIDKSEEFAIGGYNSNNDGNFEGCHDDIIIFKRSLAINEINDITEAIFNETIIEE